MVRIHGKPELLPPNQVDFDEVWRRSRDLVRRIAHEQRQFSVSPRPDKPFNVGAGFVLLTPARELMHVGTSNYKQAVGPRQHLCPDCCAEVFGITTARKMKCQIVGMAVEAPPQPDDQSRIDFGVTVSCWYCRYEFRLELSKKDSPLMPETWLLFINPDDPSKDLEERVGTFLERFPNDPRSLDSPELYANRSGP